MQGKQYYIKIKTGIKKEDTWEVEEAEEYDKTIFLKTSHFIEN